MVYFLSASGFRCVDVDIGVRSFNENAPNLSLLTFRSIVTVLSEFLRQAPSLK
jgi:hypothetical protein